MNWKLQICNKNRKWFLFTLSSALIHIGSSNLDVIAFCYLWIWLTASINETMFTTKYIYHTLETELTTSISNVLALYGIVNSSELHLILIVTLNSMECFSRNKNKMHSISSIWLIGTIDAFTIKVVGRFNFTYISHFEISQNRFHCKQKCIVHQILIKMVRAIVFVLYLIVASALAENLNTNVNVDVVENLDEYLSQHPEVKLLRPLEKIVAPKSESPFILITYRLGNRINGKFESHLTTWFLLL